MEGVLDMPETNAQGKDVLDEMWYLIPIKYPATLSIALQDRAYPTNT